MASTRVVTATINGKDLVVTMGASETTTAAAAAAFRDAWNATSRLDSEGTTTATSNFGGQEFGEFAEEAFLLALDEGVIHRNGPCGSGRDRESRGKATPKSPPRHPGGRGVPLASPGARATFAA